MTSTIIPQPPAVPFDPAAFLAIYPIFAAVSTPQLQNYYDLAGGFCANSTCNPAFCDGTLTSLLFLLTAHIAWLQSPRDANGNPSSTGTPAPPLVGRVSSANQGSVSVSLESQYPPGTPQWYQQTQWGATYWAMTAGYRTMRYVPRPTRVFSAVYTGRRGLF